jgi:hypothetical protein
MEAGTLSKPHRQVRKARGPFKPIQPADEDHPWRDIPVSGPPSDSSTTASPSQARVPRKLVAMDAKQQAVFQELSELEQDRLKNIARNRALFRALGMDGTVEQVHSARWAR